METASNVSPINAPVSNVPTIATSIGNVPVTGHIVSGTVRIRFGYRNVIGAGLLFGLCSMVVPVIAKWAGRTFGSDVK